MLDKTFKHSTAKMDLDSIARQYSLDTALLIDGILFRYNVEGINRSKSYGKLLNEAIDFKKQCDLLLQKQQTLIEKARKEVKEFTILKCYPGYQLNRGSASYFYFSTPQHLDRDALMQLVKSFESKYPLQKADLIKMPQIYHFYHNNNFYASIASAQFSEGKEMMISDYLEPGQPQDMLSLRKELDSTLQVSSFMKDKYVHNAYVVADFARKYFVMPYTLNETSAALGLARMDMGSVAVFSDARYENGKFYSNEGRSPLYIDKCVYEVNEFGDLYVHNMHPIGYSDILKKIK